LIDSRRQSLSLMVTAGRSIERHITQKRFKPIDPSDQRSYAAIIEGKE